MLFSWRRVPRRKVHFCDVPARWHDGGGYGDDAKDERKIRGDKWNPTRPCWGQTPANAAHPPYYTCAVRCTTWSGVDLTWGACHKRSSGSVILLYYAHIQGDSSSSACPKCFHILIISDLSEFWFFDCGGIVRQYKTSSIWITVCFFCKFSSRRLFENACATKTKPLTSCIRVI